MSRVLLIILIIVLVTSLVGNGFLFYMLNESTEKTRTLTTQA